MRPIEYTLKIRSKYGTYFENCLITGITLNMRCNRTASNDLGLIIASLRVTKTTKHQMWKAICETADYPCVAALGFM